jgi:2'-5' RNA ligase
MTVIDQSVDETALVILVPEAEPVVGRWRAELDSSAMLGVPAHITLLYPFAPADCLTDELIDEVATTIRGFGSFRYQLNATRWFDNSVVWLAPDPAEPFVALTWTLARAFPQFPRYGGAFGDEVVPHLTVGNLPSVERLKEAARSVSRSLPIDARADEVAVLVRGRSTEWSVSASVPLAVTDT